MMREKVWDALGAPSASKTESTATEEKTSA
jgi:hypothetical protein